MDNASERLTREFMMVASASGPSRPRGPIIDDELDEPLFGPGVRRWMGRALRAGVVAGLLMVMGGLGIQVWQRSSATPAPTSASTNAGTTHAPSSHMSVPAMLVGTGSQVALSSVAGVTVCTSFDADAISTAAHRSRTPVVPTMNIDERDTARSERKPSFQTPVVRMRSSGESATSPNIEIRDNFVGKWIR